MILYILLTLVTLLFAYKVKLIEYGSNTRGQASNTIFIYLITLILFSVSFFRYNTGNDYVGYISKCHDAYYDYCVVTEPGFNFLTKICYWFFGKEQYIALFGIFAFATVIIFLKAMEKASEDFFTTFFLFMMLGYYFQSLSTIRYYLALAIILYSVRYIEDRKYIRFVAAVLIAALFHKSALIVIPIFLIANISFKAWQYVLFAAAALSGFVFKRQFLMLFLKLYPTYANNQEDILSGSQTVIGIARCLAVLVLAICLYKKAVKGNRRNTFYFNLNFFALLLYGCFSFVPYLSRIGYYLTITHILFIPSLINSIDNRKIKKFVKAGVYVVAVIYFAAFLYKASGDGIKILPYKTWLGKDLFFEPVVPYSLIELL